MEHTLLRYKTALYATGIAALALVSLSALWYASTYAKSLSPENGWNTIAVTGEGKVTAIPDVAQISFSVTTEGGKDTAAAQEETNKKMDDITKFLMDQGVKKEDVMTTNYSVSPRYQYFGCTSGACRNPEVIGYTVSQAVSVKVRDTSKAGEILAGAISRGANGASGPTFVVDDPTKLQEDARAKAIDQAKQKAESLARQSGIHLGKILSVSDDSSAQPYPMYDSAYKGGVAMESAAPATANIQPGSQDVTANVTLTYSIR